MVSPEPRLSGPPAAAPESRLSGPPAAAPRSRLSGPPAAAPEPPSRSQNDARSSGEQIRGEQIRTGVQPTAKLRSLPPLDPTVHSLSEMRLPISTTPSVPLKPVLASECLRDDIAPLKPFDARTARAQLSLGLLLLALGLAMGARVLGTATRVDALVAVISGIAVSGPVLARRSYAVRAYIGLIVALAMGALGFLAVGPAAHWSSQPISSAIRFLAPVVLSVSLLLRVTYRASVSTRVGIGAGVALFLVAASHVGGVPVWHEGVGVAARVFSGLMVAVAALSLLGFMGEETTAACGLWASLSLALGGGALVVDAFSRGTVDSSTAVGGIAGLLCVAVASTALYQLGSLVIGPRARRKERDRRSLPPPSLDERLESMPPVEE